eukprot:scaffold1748_cov148-Skeletonema_menzelii.AAC.3
MLTLSLSLLLLAAVTVDAFVSPSHHYGRQQITNYVVSNHQRGLVPFQITNSAESSQILYMTESDSEESDETEGDAATDNDDTIEEEEESPSEVISTYKTKISAQRIGTTARPGSSAKTPIDVTMKFGGSSLANGDRIDHVANLIKGRINPPPNKDGSPSDENPVRPRAVICSAMGKTTNSLLAAGEMALEGRVDIEALRTLHLGTCRQFDLPDRTRNDVEKLLNECEDMLNGVRLIQELSPKSLDQLVSYGERCSVRIMAARLNQIGVPAQAFDAWDVGVFTDDTYGDAKLLSGTIASIKERFDGRVDPNVVAVVTGHNMKGKITTLGRGGSDLTATAIGAALNVDEVQVWKDVDGILTADPRLVKNALPVLHPIAMQPALHANIPVRVKNSYNPSAPGSVIDNVGNPSRMVTAITCKRNISLMDITSLQMLGAYGFLGAVFADFEKNKVSVDVLASSEVSISVTLDKKQKENDIEQLRDDLSRFAEVELHRDRAILTLITDVSRSSDVLATVFATFSMHGIQVEMMSQGASKVNISFIIRDDQIDDAILKLHSCLFEGQCDVAIIEDGHIV